MIAINPSVATLIQDSRPDPKIQELWADAELIELQVKSDDEPRFLVVGLIANKHWSAVVTYRGGTIRIISVRRSRKKEVKLYES